LHHKVLLIMNNKEEQLQALSDIRNMMERSSKFISLSGLSGVFVGLLALIASSIIFCLSEEMIPNSETQSKTYYDFAIVNNKLNVEVLTIYAAVALSALLLSFAISGLLTIRKAKKQGIKIWDETAKRLFINMIIPLVTGGLVCLILLYHLQVQFIAPMMLVFYGLALVNASKYTYDDIRNLGIIEIVLGLAACIFVEQGLILWAFGFGIMHIFYGVLMYFKYDKKQA
jgi:hypothetical protein